MLVIQCVLIQKVLYICLLPECVRYWLRSFFLYRLLVACYSQLHVKKGILASNKFLLKIVDQKRRQFFFVDKIILTKWLLLVMSIFGIGEFICRHSVVFCIVCAFQHCHSVTACWPYRVEPSRYPTVRRIHGQFML